ncbi:MAG TPA: EEP domain-containing protein [Gammaproteobacteria bacterium]|nr:EEP domain-containing protein [Gammaproteobacteria bacterium]
MLAEKKENTQQRQPDGGRRLRLLSYNIQTGTTTNHYRQFFTQSWRQVLPHSQRIENLASIAQMAGDYDIVGLQEVDAGSLRTGFINQTEYIATRAHFPFWFHQTNRKLGKIAQHSNGLLSKFKPSEISDHKLPGLMPGRGALFARFGHGDHSLVVVILHLALGQKARMRQLEYVADVASDFRHVVVMGDMNCQPNSKEIRQLLLNSDLHKPSDDLFTWPSWQPKRSIDHILVSSSLRVEKSHVLSHTYSDHLPIAMEVTLPEEIRIPL